MSFIPTLTIMNRLKERLESLKAPDQSPLFEMVRLYDSADLMKAFADALVTQERRLCFIIPAKHTYERKSDGNKIHVTKTAQFALLICDTDRETGQDAVFGGPDNIGVIGLSDQTIEDITGAQLDLPHVCIEPVEGDDILVYNEQQQPSDSGRKGWFQIIQTKAGTSTKNLLNPRHFPTTSNQPTP